MSAGVSLRMISLATVSALTVASSALADGAPPAPAPATDAKIIAYGGSLDPYFIRIHPFYGNLHPFIGDPQTYYGDANPYVKDLVAYYLQGSQSSDSVVTDGLVQNGNLISSSVTVKAAFQLGGSEFQLQHVAHDDRGRRRRPSRRPGQAADGFQRAAERYCLSLGQGDSRRCDPQQAGREQFRRCHAGQVSYRSDRRGEPRSR